MAVLLLRLAAPLQSWGNDDSKFETRKTWREPSKSGVIGMIAAALGYKRYETEKILELNKLRFGVRVDREGKLLRDFHKAKSSDKDKIYVTYRYYLADAIFLVGLEGKRETLERISEAVSHPVFPLYLGRRSCQPTLPIDLGIREADLIEALTIEPVLDNTEHRASTARIITDAEPDDRNIAVVRDLAASFDVHCRKYNYRNVKEHAPVKFESTEHDPFEELEDADVSLTNQT